MRGKVTSREASAGPRIPARTRAGGANRSPYTASTERRALPPEYLRKYCLRGVAEQRGLLRIQRGLRERVRFKSISLHEPRPQIGRFDVVFLRDVLIYFSQTTRQQVISRIEPLILPNGYLFVNRRSCVRKAVKLGGVDEVLPLQRIAEAIQSRAG
jgi:chemotaxis methyl-accepting protein methylase